jgi:DNA-binding response OmpR family regulator
MRLLVVDDNREHTDSLALFLRMQGHQVRTAYDAASALTWQVAFAPDAVLLDLGMPAWTATKCVAACAWPTAATAW